MPTYGIPVEKRYYHKRKANAVIDCEGVIAIEAATEAEARNQVSACMANRTLQTNDPRITWDGDAEDPQGLADRGYVYEDFSFQMTDEEDS